MLVQQLNFLGSGLEPVHARHLDVHEYQFVHLVAARVLKPLFNHFHSHLAVDGFICFESVEELQELLHDIDIVRRVVNYQNVVSARAGNFLKARSNRGVVLLKDIFID